MKTVDRHGRVIASAPYPGQGARLIARLDFGGPGKLPVDRYLALPAVAAVCALIASLSLGRARKLMRNLRKS